MIVCCRVFIAVFFLCCHVGTYLRVCLGVIFKLLFCQVNFFHFKLSFFNILILFFFVTVDSKLNFLLRNECAQPSGLIWSISMWHNSAQDSRIPSRRNQKDRGHWELVYVEIQISMQSSDKSLFFLWLEIGENPRNLPGQRTGQPSMIKQSCGN